jgi:hypothetical protein
VNEELLLLLSLLLWLWLLGKSLNQFAPGVGPLLILFCLADIPLHDQTPGLSENVHGHVHVL